MAMASEQSRTDNPDGLQNDLPDVEANVLQRDGRISLEEAIAAQLQEVEALQQPLGEPEEEPVENVEDPQQAPVEQDTPEEETYEAEAAEVEAPDEEELEYLFQDEGKGIDLEEAKRGYFRHKDYSQKTEKLAQERAELDNLRQQAVAERERYLENLARIQQLDEVLHKEPDWDQYEDDPYEFAEQQKAWRKVQDRQQVLKEEVERVRQEQQNQYNEQLTTFAKQEVEHLLEKVPEWRDTEQANKFLGDMNTYLQGYGYTPEEIKSLVDHRVFLIVKDAMAGGKTNSKAPLAHKKVAKARKGITRGKRTMGEEDSRQTNRIKQATENLTRDGSIEDAIELQLAELGVPYDDGIR